MISKASVDPLIQKAYLDELAAAYFNGADPGNPLVSPIGAALQGPPPLLIQVGSAETLAEMGLPAVSFSTWFGLFAPKGTPRDIIAKLNAAAVEALADSAARSRFVDLGYENFPREQRTPEVSARPPADIALAKIRGCRSSRGVWSSNAFVRFAVCQRSTSKRHPGGWAALIRHPWMSLARAVVDGS